MASQRQPLVNVVTPVYNGAKFIRAAIESVLAQTYENWVYTIVDNHSTDGTSEIIAEYAAAEPRIRVLTNPQTVPLMDNWNIAVGAIDPQAAYYRLLCTDDELHPTVIARAVALAEANPSIGMVATLRTRGEQLQGRGLPPGREVYSGREVVRGYFQREHAAIYPTATLVRTELVRERVPFYDTRYLHADMDTCFDLLRKWDYGFIHEDLHFAQDHPGSIGRSVASKKQTPIYEDLLFLEKYGNDYFTKPEMRRATRKLLYYYYRIMIRNAFASGGSDLNKMHLERLRQIGRAPKPWDFLLAVADKAASRLALSR